MVDSIDLRVARYRVFILESSVFKKGFNRDFPISKSISEIVQKLVPESRDNLISVKRCLDNGVVTDKVEFTCRSQYVPQHLFVKKDLSSFCLAITPIIHRPPRCFKCQRFSHVADQCRSTSPVCSHYSGKHLFQNCPSRDEEPICSNCKGPHESVSINCPIYDFEYVISKYRYLNNCNRLLALKLATNNGSEFIKNTALRTLDRPSSDQSKLVRKVLRLILRKM